MAPKVELVKPIEIKVPEVTKGFEPLKPLLPEGTKLSLVPEGNGSSALKNDGVPVGGMMRVTPDLATSLGVRYSDLAAANPKMIQHDAMMRSPVPKSVIAVTAFLGFGPLLFLNPHLYSWISDHLGSFLGMLPFVGMVFAGGGGKPPSSPSDPSFFPASDGHSYQIRAPKDFPETPIHGLYEGEHIYGRKTEHRFLDNGNVQVSFDMFDTLVSFRTTDRGNREMTIEMSREEFNVMGLEQKFPSFYVLTPDIPPAKPALTLGLVGDREGFGYVVNNEEGHVVLSIDTNDASTAEQIHLQVLEAYERTGSLDLALQELQASPWKPELFTVVSSSPSGVDPSWPLDAEIASPGQAKETLQAPGPFDFYSSLTLEEKFAFVEELGPSSGIGRQSFPGNDGKNYQINSLGLADTFRVGTGDGLYFIHAKDPVVLRPDETVEVTFTESLKGKKIKFQLSFAEAVNLEIRPGSSSAQTFILRPIQ